MPLTLSNTSTTNSSNKAITFSKSLAETDTTLIDSTTQHEGPISNATLNYNLNSAETDADTTSQFDSRNTTELKDLSENQDNFYWLLTFEK